MLIKKKKNWERKSNSKEEKWSQVESKKAMYPRITENKNTVDITNKPEKIRADKITIKEVMKQCSDNTIEGKTRKVMIIKIEFNDNKNKEGIS